MKKHKPIIIKELSDEPFIDIALDTIDINKQILIFVGSKRAAESSAEKISKKIKETTPHLKELSEKILNVLQRPTKQCERLAKCIEKGIAFHHAGLASEQRELIEDNFRAGKVKVICATPTLAAGVDLPAFRTIIKDLKRYGGNWGMDWIPVLEYIQMAGRAGRPGKEDYGEAICIAQTEGERDDIYEKYVLGVPEPIYSKLAVEPVLRTYILSLIATDIVRSQKEIYAFFSKTFWAYQFEDLSKLKRIIVKMLNLLEEFEFIKLKKEEFVSANEYDSELIEATLLGKRVAELYIDPVTANNIVIALNKKDKISTFSLLHLISSQLEIRPFLKAKVAEVDKIRERLLKEELVIDEPVMYDPDYGEFINSVKTALFFDDWINEKDEEELLEKYSIRPGEIKVKLDNADWLLYAAEELAKLMPAHEAIKEILKLRIRLKNGVREELLPLLQLKDIGRVRARKLFANKIKDIKDVKSADITVLAQIVGKKIAANVKQQVGEVVEQVPEGKRKGQISLLDY